MKGTKILMNYNKTNKKCFNSNMNNYWRKAIHRKKSQSILENVIFFGNFNLFLNLK